MDLHPVLCRDRDSGAVCCCSGCWRERTAARRGGSPAGTGTGMEGTGRRGGAAAADGSRGAAGTGPDAEGVASCGCSSLEATGTNRAAHPARRCIGLVKSLNLYICVWFLRPRV